ncbi:hypothetical protein JHK82_019082 [Glycine max]|nr:hypothetical protein JHK85_019521 [Glycine max]KAG5143387.1 hypothetical protein JHK82_019082 [Glycine max]
MGEIDAAFIQSPEHRPKLSIIEAEGIPIEAAARKFFGQSKEEKSKVRRDNDGVKVMGYYDSEHTKNVRDWKEVFDYTVEEPTMMPASLDPNYHKELTHWYNQWPQYPPEFRGIPRVCSAHGRTSTQVNGAYCFELRVATKTVSWLLQRPNPNLVLGLGRHKDSGALTVLAQDDVSGLEVKRKSDGEWIRVKPTTPDFILSMLET